MRTRYVALLACVLALSGCDFADPSDNQHPDSGPVAVPVVPPQEPAHVPADAHRFGEPHPSTLPRPINGGTLIVTRNGKTAVAADPDRDRISIVDLVKHQVTATVPLERGVEPGRLVEDGSGRVHVLLRATGEVATIDLAAAEVTRRRSVCPVPQGIAYRGIDDSLLVACTSGQLVTLPAKGGEATRDVRIEEDLRDVIVSGDRTFVTRFKSAELLELDGDGKIIARTQPPGVSSPFILSQSNKASGDAHPFTPSVAWRAIEQGDGSVLMLHQRGRSDTIELNVHSSPAATPAVHVDVDADAGTCFDCGSSSPGGNAYGTGSFLDCDSIVHSTLSRISADGVTAGPVLPDVTLAVDAAASADGKYVAIGVAGNFNDRTLPVSNLGVLVLPLDQAFEPSAGKTCAVLGTDFDSDMLAAGQVVAVAFTGDHTLVIQSRDPNHLLVVEDFTGPCLGCSNWSADIDLGGTSMRDQGHDLFHTNAGAGLSCASCHPGGGDDGRTWNFSTVGARRTQLFNMGVEDTLPLHWDGELATFDALIQEVFVRRVGGVPPSSDQEGAAASWIESLHPNNRIRASDDPAALRGKTLFDSPEVGCTNCHNGAKLTNNMTVDVGTGGSFQVPSLIGVAYHQPYIHNGCAKTLRERFDPECGGKLHGNTQQLDEKQIDDLVAYLEAL